jgi:outer membrane protein OmpA-like peptidoglycan-associated protein/tetratricopeptide (TPR) repeat protein
VSLPAQINRYLRKAARATENGYLEQARQYYLKALEKDSNDYRANLGLGITLSEFMDRPEEAIRYLERAYRVTPADTLPDLIFALGKVYEHFGRYREAIPFFDKLAGVNAVEEDDALFQMDVKKRKEDCLYGIEHNFFTDPKDWYVVNVGKNINTDMPEYVPVLTPGNELLFTSKRQDDKKERINDLDGKYFESMYISKIENGRFTPPRRYTIPDLFSSSKFRKHHESIISMSPDGKKLFLYRDNKIYEVSMDNLQKESPKKLSKSINFDYYQNHAFLSKDGKTLYFTSEGRGGVGGIDIWKAEKTGDGTWSKPENLGTPVNTEYDEDAPFITDDGQTLYFASRGHPGFGNFDIYKSNLVNGKWSAPENLGRPINSAAHDIFMVTDSAGKIGYFSSSRVGGKGDMDIYKINYFKNFNKECVTTNDPNVSINAARLNDSSNAYTIKADLSEHFKILSFGWKVNGQAFNASSNQIEYSFDKPGTYPVEVKIVSYCDTCIEPYVACKIQNITIEKAVPTVTTAPTQTVDLANVHGQLTKEQMLALGFDVTPIHFNFNKQDVREDGQTILNKNLEVLKKHPELFIDINGHADSQGKAHRNQQLSLQRANSVKSYLLKNGLSKKQIRRTVGRGSKELLNDCVRGEDCTKEQNEVNRRVEINVFKK